MQITQSLPFTKTELQGRTCKVPYRSYFYDSPGKYLQSPEKSFILFSGNDLKRKVPYTERKDL